MYPTNLVRQHQEAETRRAIMEKLKKPTGEMLMAGYHSGEMAHIGIPTVRRIFLASA